MFQIIDFEVSPFPLHFRNPQIRYLNLITPCDLQGGLPTFVILTKHLGLTDPGNRWTAHVDMLSLGLMRGFYDGILGFQTFVVEINSKVMKEFGSVPQSRYSCGCQGGVQLYATVAFSLTDPETDLIEKSRTSPWQPRMAKAFLETTIMPAVKPNENTFFHLLRWKW